ncbi:type II toxin-antitoxin system RelB family antitoxin [Peptococcus simiae]|uniref:type II toxin-antitoxin system RelB family antitoxin n=1 Tax=Peptococcus simiae TaxID=1643805 RepID=UPI0039818D69
MSMVSLRLNESEEELFKSYAAHTGRPLSELFKRALAEQIEDELDYKTGILALAEYQKSPQGIGIDELIEELESGL